MAKLIRSAKSSSDWNQVDLDSYNISVSSLPPDKFFPTPDPSLDGIDPAILDSPLGGPNPALSNAAAKYLSYLSFTRANQECFINSFIIETLRLLDFDEYNTVMSIRHTIPFTICGINSVAQPDLSLIHDRGFVLLSLVQEKGSDDGEAQVVAQAIAVFQFNNRMRREYGLSPLDAMTIPCITISRTRPTFYLAPVTTELSEAVIGGRYPKHTTQVLSCHTVPKKLYISFGMWDTEYRKLALKCFLAFKELAKSHWVRVLEGT